MSEQKLDIIIEATVNGAVKGLQAAVASLESLPAAAVTASKGVDKLATAIEKAEKPAFDLGKAIKEAQERVSASVDKMAADAVSAGNKLEASTGPIISAFNKLKSAAGGAANVFNGASLGAAKFVPVVKQIPATLEKVTKSTGSATQALTNLGRVAQDAPFGFIGIANNLNPLLESFQRLKIESGSSGAALKALGGSLIGAGGIGLALSAVTAAVTFAQMGFRAWGGSAKESAAKVKNALAEVSKSAADDLVKLQSYVGFATDVNKSINERAKAVNALQKEYPQYLKNISDEAILTGQATDAINKSIDAILRKATLSLLKDEIAAAVAETAKQVLAVQKSVIATEQAAAAEKSRAENLKGQTDEFNKQAEAALRSGRAIGELPAQFQKLGAASQQAFANRPDEKIRQLKEDLIKLVQPLVNAAVNFEDLGASAEKGLKKTKEKVVKAVEEIRHSINTFAGLAGTTGALILDAVVKFREDQVKQEVKNVEELVKTLNSPIVIPVSLGKLDATDGIREQLEKFKEEQKVFRELNEAASAGVAQGAVEAARGNIEKLKGFVKELQDQQQILKQIATDAFASIGEGIGAALAGKKNPFASFLGVLADGLSQLGRYLISISSVIKAIKAALNTPGINGVGLLIGGIALVAIGAAIKSRISQQKFAEGGIVSGPTNALIGEAGQSEVVIPLSRLSGMLNGGQANGGRVEFVISGQNLLGTLNRATSSRGRTFG